MFAQLFNKSLTLKINDRTLKFDSKSDFEFALASRTEVPAAKISDFVRFNPQQLLDEASSVRQVERHFVETLSRSIQEPGSIGYLLREMDMKMFSQDHEWRTIMQGLTRQERRFNDYKQLALVKYMQYLASRQDVLKGIYTHKVTSGVNPEPDVDPMQNPEFRQTLIFDVSDPVAAPEQPNEAVAPSRLVRLPRGERINLRATDSKMIELVLSRHSFRLRAGANPILVDDEDNEYPLQFGRNVLGRHTDSDVMVDAAYRDVSRTHAIVDVHDNGDVFIIDLSSHGTFVDANFTERN